MKNTKNKQLVGIFWMVSHCFLISVMSAIVRATAEDIPVLEIVFFYNAFAFLLMLPFALTAGRKQELKTKKLHLHLGRALLGAISLSMYFYAFTVIPLTEARAVALTGPLVSSLVAVIFLKEIMGWHRILALVVGFSGALVILRPGVDGFSYVSLMVVACVSMWSVIDLMIKMLSRTESNINQIFYLTGGMALFSLPGAIYFWQMPAGFLQWVIMLLLGAIFLVNALAVTNAFRNGDVTVVMPFDFSGMIFTIIIAYIAFGEILDLWTGVGAAVIMISSVYILRREARLAKKNRSVVPHDKV
jgi:drug/metabolite transporter (DMT)-like permease